MLEFNDQAEAVMKKAKQAAADFRHPAVHTIHILLALTENSAGIAFTALKNFDLTTEAIVGEIEELSGIGLVSQNIPGDLPWTISAQEITQSAPQKAQELKHIYIGPEHLLLALLDTESTATNAMINLGVSPRRVMVEVLGFIGFEESSESKPRKSNKEPAHEFLIEEIENIAQEVIKHYTYIFEFELFCELLGRIEIPRHCLPGLISRLKGLSNRFHNRKLQKLISSFLEE